MVKVDIDFDLTHNRADWFRVFHTDVEVWSHRCIIIIIGFNFVQRFCQLSGCILYIWLSSLLGLNTIISGPRSVLSELIVVNVIVLQMLVKHV